MSGWDLFGPGGSSGHGEWEKMSPLMSRRRKPDGTWEVKLTPSFTGGKPGLGKVDQPDTSAGAVTKEALKTAGTAWMKNLATAPEQAETVLALPGAAVRKLAQPKAPALKGDYDYDSAIAAGIGPDETGHWPSRVDSGPLEGLILKNANHPTFAKTVAGEKAAGFKIVERDGRLWSVPADDPGLLGPLATSKGDLGRLSGKVSDIHQRQTERLADASQDSPILGTAAYAAAELGAGLLDPTNLPAAGAASRVPGRPLAEAAMQARAAGRTPGALEALAESAELRPEAGEMKIPDWLLKLMGEPIPPDDMKRQIMLGLRAHPEDADAIAKLSLPIGETEQTAERAALEAAGIAAPRKPVGPGGSGPDLPSMPQIGAEPPLSGRPKMSTKGITNVAGMQPDLQELAADNFDLVYKARGAPRPVSIYHDAKALADQTGLTLDDFLAGPAGSTWNDREVALGRSLLGGLRNRIKETAVKVDSGILDGETGRAALADDRLKLAKLMATLQGKGASEWGRGLRSLQEAVDPLGLTAGQGEKIQLGLIKRYSDQLDDDVMKKISMLGDDPESPDLLNFLRAMENPRFNDYRGSYWINSILSGPKTQQRNLIGNAVRLAELTVMRPAGAGVEQALARLQGRTPERYLREAIPATVGVFRGIPEGIRKFAFVMRKGYNPDRLIEDLTGEGGEALATAAGGRLPLDPFLLSKNRGTRAVGVAVTMPSRILSSVDALFRTMASTSEMYASATRTGIKEGLKGDALAARATDLIANPTPEMLASARAFSKQATYTDPMSAIGRWAAQGREVIPGGEHLMPFIHVSDRVAAVVTDYIPGAKPGKLYRLLRDKDPAASDLIARQVVGGAIGMMGLSWAGQGKLVGAAPKDEKLRSDFYAEGKQPYSLLVGGRWVPIRDVAGPWAGPLVAAVALHDHFQEDPAGTNADQVVQAAGGMALSSAKYMLDASYLQTLQDVVSSVEEERGEVGKGMVQAGTRVVGGYVPFSGLQRGIAGAIDPRVVEKEGAIDELKAGIPGLRQTLPARIGPLGEELEISTGRMGALSPVVPTESNIADPQLDERIDRLRYTLQGMRTDYGRTERKIDDTQRGRAGAAGLEDGKAEELAARGAALRGELPAIASPTGAIDQTMDDIRELEDELRRVRANRVLQPAIRKEREIALQLRMQTLLERALKGLGGEGEIQSDNPTPAPPSDEWDVFNP